MPVESKPLFRPDALRPYLSTFVLSSQDIANREKILKWAELLHSPKGHTFREQELLPDFITDVFCSLLGYTRPADSPERYTRAREKYIQVDGKYADAVLGDFGQDIEDNPIVAVEGKGPKDPLERPYSGRKKSAVDQGYGYAINLRCDWIIVTSMRQTRLYHKGSDQLTYERFDIRDLAQNDAVFRKFVFILSAERVVPTKGASHLYKLKEASEKVGQTLTKSYYVRYADLREDIFDTLCAENPSESRHAILSATQKVLDRVLFTAFCEDRGLLPDDSLKRAFEHADPYNPRPIWNNFRGLFRSIDAGNPDLNIPPYNGGLFADDPFLEKLKVPDAVCAHFRELGEYEYRAPSEVSAEADSNGHGGLIDVEVLGHIFEQSISDLEQIRNELDGIAEPVGKEKHKSRRKKEGAFYTPAFITRYIVEQTLRPVLDDRFQALRLNHAAKAQGTAKKSLADPSVYDLDKLNNPQRAALVFFWEAWQEELRTVRVLDPACGSGAFLIETFDQLHSAYVESNDRLEELRGQRSLFDLDRRILQENLFGVDINDEAIQICRLSLWIKTAERGKTLTSLDDTICVGNSIVSDPKLDNKAFDWDNAFSNVRAAGGFDVVVGNPPYIRQEMLSSIKPHLEQRFSSYHGMADLYVYFYELGLSVLKPGGRLSLVVTNKWMKASYGEPLRRFFCDLAWMESIVDFGHAKQIFPDADVFPGIVVARKPLPDVKHDTTRICTIPRDQLRIDDLSNQIESEGFTIPSSKLGASSWTIEPDGLADLLSHLVEAGTPLKDYANASPLFGIKTGFNAAYLIDTAMKNSLVAADPSCERLMCPYLRGRDLNRWSPVWENLWVILLKSSANESHPWSNEEDEAVAEELFSKSYPSVFSHMKSHEDRLKKRSDQGQFWWELRSCAYYDVFASKKIMWQDLGYHSRFCLSPENLVAEATCFSLASSDLWLLAVLNSPIMWSWFWRNTIHGKDEVLRLKTIYTEKTPIPQPTDKSRQSTELNVSRLIEITNERHNVTRNILDWLAVEFELPKPGTKLEAATELSCDEFVAEVKKRRGRKNPLTVAGLKALRDEYAETLSPVISTTGEATRLEQAISNAVNNAFGLTPEQVDLMWKTAPPRMPLASD